MADEDIAVHESSGDDYDTKPSKKDDKDGIKDAKAKGKKGFTWFDFFLMLGFATLIGGMLWLKHRAEIFVKDKDKIEMNIRVPRGLHSLGRQPLQGARRRP